MPSTISIKDDMQQLFLHRQIICDIVKASPFFGSDYTDKYFWNKKDHPYKNLCNCILWCEYWYEKIKVSNKQEKILPKYRSVEILATNQEMQQHLDNIHALANSIRDKILNDNVDISDFGPNLTQYNLEQKLFAEITPNLDFLRPKLETMYEVLQEIPPILEKNKAITHDFKDCFIKANLSMKRLEINLHKLVDKYGIDELNNYAKSAWINYSNEKHYFFNIQSILDDTYLMLPNYYQDIGGFKGDGIMPQEIKEIEEQIINMFFSEVFAIYNSYQKVSIYLKKIRENSTTWWDLNLLENIMLLYTENKLISRYELIEQVKRADNNTLSYEDQYKYRQKIIKSNLLWRFATRVLFLKNLVISQIDLSKENRWQIYHYRLYCQLNILLNHSNMYESGLDITFKQQLLHYMQCYFNNKSVSNIYMIALLFSDVSFLDLTQPFSEIQRIVMLLIQHEYFEIIYR